jgi:hypothetical protein
LSGKIQSLPGARELLAYLTRAQIPWCYRDQRPYGDRMPRVAD